MRDNKKIMICVIAICIAVTIAVGLFIYLRGDKTPPEGTSVQTTQKAPELPDSVTGTQKGIRVAGYPEITIPAGEKDVVLNLMNPEGNPCTFTFTVKLNEGDEVLFTSEPVKPGDYIGTATLTRALEAGEYEATINITTASLKDGSPMNGANLDTKLIVK